MTIETVIAARATTSALNTILQVGSLIKNDIGRVASFVGDGSMVSLTQSSRVEPLCIVGGDCLHLEYMPDILQSASSIFAGYYLQAVAMTTQVYGTKVTRMLDKLNPDRKSDLATAALSVYETEKPSDWRLSSLAYEHRLPTTHNKNAMAFEQLYVNMQMHGGTGNPKVDYAVSKSKLLSIGKESITEEYQLAKVKGYKGSFYDFERNSISEKEKKAEKTDKSIKEQVEDAVKNNELILARNNSSDDVNIAFSEATAGGYTGTFYDFKKTFESESRGKNVASSAIINQDAIKSVREITDLSVGKMISVTVGGGTDSYGKEIKGAVIPISIRLMVNTISDSSLVTLLSSGAMDNSLRERYHMWKAGRIEFIRDLVFCCDLIDEQKKAMISDKSGVHDEIVRRVNNARIAGLADRNPSLNVAANIYVISEVTAAALERKIGGKLTNPSIRNKIFESGYAILVLVVDRQREVVTFYHRGIATSTTVGLRSITIANKGTGPNIGDIMKAYQMGSSPQL